MIKLVKNELYKIFHKKLLFVLLIITVFGTIFINVMDLLITNPGLEVTANKKMVEIYESSGDTSSPEYFNAQASLYTSELIANRNIPEKSPQEYLVQSQIQPAYYDYLSNQNEDPNSEATITAKNRVDELVALLDTYNWKDQINDMIKDTKEEDCMGDKDCELVNNETVRVLEYRLKHNIPYSTNDASGILDVYIAEYSAYLKEKKIDDNKLSYDKKLDKREVYKNYFTYKYMIDNDLLENDYKMYSPGVEMVEKFKSPSFIIVILLLGLCASTVAEEFNKGTIKQLLVKPYSRSKIVLSKMIAVFLTVVLFYFIVNISTVVIDALFLGNLNDIFKNDVVYNYATNQCISMSYIKESLLSFVYVLPMLILLGIFVFAMSVLTTNTAFSLGMGFGAYLSESIFQLLLDRFKFLSYMPTLNYNLTTYMFGGISNYEILTLNKAIIVDIVSFVVLFIMILVVFKKKDIKNQ